VAAGGGVILVNLAELAWSAERRRNAAMFVELVRSARLYERGIFVDPPRLYGSRPRLGARAQAIAQLLRPDAIGERAERFRPAFALPFSFHPRLRVLAARALVAPLLARVRGRPFCLWVNNVDPPAFSIFQALAPRAARVVFDLSDDWSAYEDRDPVGRDARMAAILARADAVLAVNAHVHHKFPHRRGRVFENGTDFDNFRRRDPGYRLADVLPKPPGRKIVGFIGGLHRGRADEPLLERLVAALPEAEFLFVGYSNDPGLMARLRAHANVRVLGPVPHDEVPFVIQAFDVAIVPHLDNELTRGNDLLKVLDYLAAGVPVVSTDSSNVRARYGQAVDVVTAHGAFVARVRHHLEARAHDPAPGLAIAEAASWRRRMPELEAWLAQALETGPETGRSSNAGV
jgi:glycosyltransferase involved in cell wall biosynthesis